VGSSSRGGGWWVGEERKDGCSMLLSQTRGFRRLHRIPKWKLVPELRVSTLLCTLVSSHGTIFPPPSNSSFFFLLSLTLTQLSLFSRVTTEAGMLMLENQFWPLFFGCFFFFFWHPIYSSRKHSRVSNVVVLKEGGEGGG
jgi:hypothetical protein